MSTLTRRQVPHENAHRGVIRLKRMSTIDADRLESQGTFLRVTGRSFAQEDVLTHDYLDVPTNLFLDLDKIVSPRVGWTRQFAVP